MAECRICGEDFDPKNKAEANEHNSHPADVSPEDAAMDEMTIIELRGDNS